MPAEAPIEPPQDPKINFTFAGEAKVDLGFDNTRSRGPPVQSQGPRPLTWRAMRQAGAGFWLTDPDSVKKAATELAKAQFAASKDPHDAALMYLALGKKQLLQV